MRKPWPEGRSVKETAEILPLRKRSVNGAYLAPDLPNCQRRRLHNCLESSGYALIRGKDQQIQQATLVKTENT